MFPEDAEEAGLSKSLSRVRRQFEAQYNKYKYLSFSFGLARAKSSLKETIAILDLSLIHI